MQQVIIITVVDGADFERRMDRKAFATYKTGDAWGAKRVEELRAKRREEGETDEAFIEAITWEWATVPFQGEEG